MPRALGWMVVALLGLGCDDRTAEAGFATTAWPDAPAGFEPMVLPSVDDACDGTTVWVGQRTVERVEVPGARMPEGEPEVGDLPEGVARDVARVVRPTNPLTVMVGSYNGPGGEGLFRWRMRQGPQIVLLFDRRISRERFDAAILGASNESGWPIRIGGVNETGQRRCAQVFLGIPDDTMRDGATEVWPARVRADGGLEVAGAYRATLSPTSPTPLSGEPESGVHVFALRADPSVAPEAVVRGLAVARWTQHRYGWLPPVR